MSIFIVTITALFAGLLCAILALWIYRDMNTVRVTKYIIHNSKVKKPFRFVFLSDLHGASLGTGNRKLIDLIDSIKPDAIISGGDLYTSHPGDGCEAAAALIEDLASKYTVYMTNGNHETKTRIHSEEFDNLYESYMDRVKKAGARVIINDSIDIEESNIRLTGFEIRHNVFRHFVKVPLEADELEKDLGKASEDRFNLLLAHHPIYLENYAKWGADLVLSGHIHGGIIRIPFFYRRKGSYIDDKKGGLGCRVRGVISPMFWILPRFDGGLFKKDKTQMILSRGLSTHTIPVRLNNPGELVEVILEP